MTTLDAPADPTVDGAPEPERRASGVRRLRPRRLGLRSRITATFTLGALVLSAFLAATTYGLARSTLVRQRDEAAVSQAYGDAQIVADRLRANPSELRNALENLPRAGASQPFVFRDGEWATRPAAYVQDDIPDQLIVRAVDEREPARMIVGVGGRPVMAVAIPLPDQDATYFEITPLDELADSLAGVRLSAVGASVITTALGVLVGSWAARRAVRPLADAASAAQAIAGGRLDTRFEEVEDRDLQVLAQSFNEMAAALQLRVERDARFASDVSHELRSPLTTLSASIEVLESRREEMPERAQAALDLLVADVGRFRNLVEDLLEISRFDAGAVRLHREELLVGEFVRQAAAVSGVSDVHVTVDPRAQDLVVSADKRRMLRVLANLIDNAHHYGAGDVTVEVLPATPDGEPIGHVQIAVEDHGPGVPAEERTLIFERFARGASAGRRGSSEGAGLGLALVDEHVRLHGGRVWVTDRTDGTEGARFVIELPVEEPA